jgi:hypothetical protein
MEEYRCALAHVSPEPLKEMSRYVGPRPFDRRSEDQARFFGRDQESKEIVSLILSNPLMSVHSRPVAGKTSLFNANILPILESHEFLTRPTVRVGGLLPSYLTYANVKNIFIFNALQSLDPIADPRTLAEKNLTFLKEYPKGRRTLQVLVIDQLKELFSLSSNQLQDELEGFFIQIAEALNNDPLLRIAFLIREEYLTQLDPFARFVKE